MRMEVVAQVVGKTEQRSPAMRSRARRSSGRHFQGYGLPPQQPNFRPQIREGRPGLWVLWPLIFLLPQRLQRQAGVRMTRVE